VKLIVKGTGLLDGKYDADFNLDMLTNGEVRVIKRLSGVRLGEIQEALRAQDNDVLVAFGVIWLTRAGKDPAMVEQVLWNAPVGGWCDLDMEETTVEADARPPDSPTASGNENSPVEQPSEIVPGEPSSSDSSNGSAHLESVPSPTGSPPSDTGPPSVLATWVT
jgi:hypothetical protein